MLIMLEVCLTPNHLSFSTFFSASKRGGGNAKQLSLDEEEAGSKPDPVCNYPPPPHTPHLRVVS